ncbi:UNVERIFIED_CONTAM: Kinesin-like protein KIN-12D [Sesamum radiatum]|uniref:Kinesin-like protein KIN-12D n=1 Tax=Sesamum radiatum TaxID=300843 RepID=A0AAW2RXG1_SESRA
MLRDFKFLRRNSGKHTNTEEVENVPVNPRDSLNPQMSTDPSRPPLNAIQEPSRIPKSVSDQDVSSFKASKIDRTPTKPRPKHSDTSMPFRTPEKQGATLRNRFNWAQKSEHQSTNSAAESKEDGRLVSNINTPGSTRAASRANLSYSECNSTQSTPTKSVNKPPNPSFCSASGSRALNAGARMANYAALSKGIPSSCNLSTVVNTVEVPYFELKEDPSFWMEHNVQVLIRIRPLNNMEKSSFGFNRCLKQESAQSITWIGQPETRFMFDHVACEAIDQETLFRMVGLPMVENCLSGYNSCMFAYGQEEESRRDEHLKYNCKCSFLEIYNEQITDLLDPSSTNLMLREDMKKGVYVENLSEFEVHTVGDILQLLTQGSSNRKVAATNMNRESSRSHSVFTCVIESRWEKDSATNFRFARLNLVDLAGSERQKSSGAEGERLKEAANINKSLSTLGHVIMVLVDVAHGKPRHVPYRDSRLTFLLQDSLGGNSKTTIIANVSPSICSAAETLNTLKFAQRAKLIQNNAIINEDSSGDVTALKHQIQLLKEELSALKREKVSRSLSFGPAIDIDTRNKDADDCNGRMVAQEHPVNMLGKESHGVLRVSCKQLKSLETTLAGSLRREQMAETSIKQLEAEIEQLNRLVSQREEDTRCTKMMLKFREDKIQRMESLVGGLISEDAYLLKENNALMEENQLLRARIDKNPEVTRFALENIRLLEQVRRFQDLYEEGEREMLMTEISELRNQLIFFLDGNSKHPNHLDTKGSYHGGNESDLHHKELKKTLLELEESKTKLNSYLEENAKLRGEIEALHASLDVITSAHQEHDSSAEVIKESIVEVPFFSNQCTTTAQRGKEEARCEYLVKHAEEILDLQLELDILKTILQEERLYHGEAEEMAKSVNRELQLSKEKVISVTKEYEKVQEELKNVKLVIEALESQQIHSINEIEDLRNSKVQLEELLKEKELEISYLKEQAHVQEFTSYKHPKSEDSPLEAKLKKMHESLEKAKRLNKWYQNDLAFQATHEEEVEEVRKQVEAETAEVIVCLQEELSALHQEVHDSKLKEIETRDRLAQLENQIKIMEDNLHLRSDENTKLADMLEDRENKLITLTEEWELIASEVEGILSGGNEALKDASDQIDVISSSIPHKRSWISEQFGRMKKYIFEKELLIEELNRCLKDAVDRRDDMERMLRSLRGAALVMTETHQQECCEKDKEILLLTSELNNKTSTIAELQSLIKNREDQLKTASACATAALVIVNRLSELNSNYRDASSDKDLQLKEFKEIFTQKDTIIQNQGSMIIEADKQNHSPSGTTSIERKLH